MFAGNPDTVVRQIKEFRQRVGGLGSLIMMTRQGLVTHAEAEKSFSSPPPRCCPSSRTWSRWSSRTRWPSPDRLATSGRSGLALDW